MYSDPTLRAGRRRAVLLVVMAALWAAVASWAAVRGGGVEVVGYALVAVLAVVGAVIFSNPYRSRGAQLRLCVAGLALVPVILLTFALSFFAG